MPGRQNDPYKKVNIQPESNNNALLTLLRTEEGQRVLRDSNVGFEVENVTELCAVFH